LEGAWRPEAPPYFHARRDAGEVVTAGVPVAQLGHRFPLPDGSLGGNWVAWHWDGDRLEVSNDRFHAYPLYYAASDTEVSVSPSIDALLALGTDRELDLDAVAAFLTIGYYLGDDTPFAAIRKIPAGVGFSWGPEGLTIDSRVPRRPSLGMSRERALEGAAELTRQAIRRCIPDDDRYVLPLSGGRDSRHLLLELIDAGHPPSACVTAHHHPHLGGGDVPFAARLSASLGLAHRAVSPGPLIEEEWRKNRLTSYCADEHAWYRGVADELNGKVSHTYDGLNGSTAMAREYYPAKVRRLDATKRLDELATYLGRKQRGQPRFAPLIAPDARAALSGERAAIRIRAELEVHASEPEPYLATRFWSRTTGELNLTSTLMLHGVPAAYTPFLDPDLVEHLWAVPSEHVDEAFHDDVIAVRFPDGNDVPYRPRTMPRPPRAFLREMNRDLVHVLRSQSDGTLVDHRRLIVRAALGAATGDGWFAWGRRASLTTYLVQLEAIVAGRGPADLP
jgi:asparagine synthase (glutamine-hydrolysing)